MAVGDNFLRWKMIRELIYRRKSGTLILQLGRCYLHWVIQSGKVLHVSSTLPEYSFTRFLLERENINHDEIMVAQSQITEQRSLGAVVLQARILQKEELQELLRDHVKELAFFLLQPGTHLFWSDRMTSLKPQFFPFPISLSEILLSVERSYLEVRSVLRFSLEMLGPYRVENMKEAEPLLKSTEKGLLPYLRRAATVSEILLSPDVDRMTCYRTLFLLWLTGHLHPLPRRVEQKKEEKPAFLERLKGIQTDWLLPLVLGILIGWILAPDRESQTLPQPNPAEPTFREMLQHPTWAKEGEPVE